MNKVKHRGMKMILLNAASAEVYVKDHLESIGYTGVVISKNIPIEACVDVQEVTFTTNELEDTYTFEVWIEEVECDNGQQYSRIYGEW